MRFPVPKAADFDAFSGLSGIAFLLHVMACLRSQNGGCPWDLEQDHASLAPCLLEEAYEAVEAIEEGDAAHMAEELGDVLLQIVFHGQIASETGAFSFDDIARREAEKMVERHPHVFGDRENVKTPDDVLKNWSADKARKRVEAKAESLLDGISTALPAIDRAMKLQKRAASVGFDWKNPQAIMGKIREETDEVEAEIQSGKSVADMEAELGDLFFVLVNLAKHLKVDPERALRRTNRKFEDRFRYIETALAARGKKPQEATLEEMDALWNEAKKEKCL